MAYGRYERASRHAIVAHCRGLGIASVTYYRWRKKYGSLKLDQAKHLKELERENARLRKAVAEATRNPESTT